MTALLHETHWESVRYNGACKCGAVYSRALRGVWHERTELKGHGIYARTTVRREFRPHWSRIDGLVYGQDDVTTGNEGATLQCDCGRRVTLMQVEGRVRDDVLCDSRCTSAKGHKCECECGGANHGADHG